MTAQIPDTIFFNDGEFSIVGVNGGELFTPESIGITPVAVASDCWRGYVCQYKISSNTLILDILQLSFGIDDVTGEERKFVPQRGPAFHGVTPTGRHPSFNNIYKGLALEIPFTGGILAGDDFIDDLYVHMGFHPAWKYRIVYELLFERGVVQEIRDISAQVGEIRNKMIQQPIRPDVLKATDAEIEAWIELFGLITI